MFDIAVSLELKEDNVLYWAWQLLESRELLQTTSRIWDMNAVQSLSEESVNVMLKDKRERMRSNDPKLRGGPGWSDMKRVLMREASWYDAWEKSGVKKFLNGWWDQVR